MPRTRFYYNRLNRRLSGLVKGRLWLQVILAMVAGILVGGALGPDLSLVSRETAEIIGRWFALPGRLFLAIIQMIIIPLVAGSIILGIAAAGAGTDLARVGGRLAIFILTTTLAGAILGGTLARWMEAGRGTLAGIPPPPSLKPDDLGSALDDPTSPVEEMTRELPDVIAGLIPANVSQAILDQDMLGIVVFSIFIGIAVVTADKKALMKPLVSFCDAIVEVCMTVIRRAMPFAPVAVFGLIAQTMVTNGAATLIDLALYAGVVVGGLILLLLLYLVLVAVFGRMSPVDFLRRVGPVQLLAFSTSSSAAVMPLTMKTAVEKLGADAPLAGAVVPLASTVNMAGTALYQSAAIVFLANMAGVTFGPFELALIMVTLTGASIGAPAAPGASVAVLSATAASFGVPQTGLPLVLGVDRLLDMVRTSVNVTGDLVICRILAVGQPPSDDKVSPPAPKGSHDEAAHAEEDAPSPIRGEGN